MRFLTFKRRVGELSRLDRQREIDKMDKVTAFFWHSFPFPTLKGQRVEGRRVEDRLPTLKAGYPEGWLDEGRRDEGRHDEGRLP